MRLINTRDLRITEFFDDKPRYAILSHTWGAEELTFQQWAGWTAKSRSLAPESLEPAMGKAQKANSSTQSQPRSAVRPRSFSFDSGLRYGHDGCLCCQNKTHVSEKARAEAADVESDQKMRSREGCSKILEAAKLAVASSLDWLWVDTVCIDKTSSVELNEAINSMYIWYRDSAVCYAFLNDVSDMNQTDQEFERQFLASRWFTRGWTLQELIAPKQLDFYSKTWTQLGNKSEGRLSDLVSERAGINRSYLCGEKDLSEASIAHKMSWLSKRITSRIEDMAYCMLGIFDISMPLLYGEGKSAFVRLQEELLRSYYDHTIFCWSWNKDVPANWVSLLAPAPSNFLNSGGYVRRALQSESAPYQMTNLGLSIQLGLLSGCTGSFFILDAEMGDEEDSEAPACVPVRLEDEAKYLFSRQASPNHPICVPLNVRGSLPRKSCFVQTRSLTRSLPSTFIPVAAPAPYLFFREEVEMRVLYPTNRLPSLPTNTISTYPRILFDRPTGVLHAGVVPHLARSDPQYAVIVRVDLAALGETGVYYVFMAFYRQGSSNGKARPAEWSLHVVSDTKLGGTYGRPTSDDRLKILYKSLCEEASHRRERTLYSLKSQAPRKWLRFGQPFQPLMLNICHIPSLLGEDGPSHP